MNAKLEEAVSALRSQRKKTAYRLLAEVIDAEPRGRDAEEAWLLMTEVVNDPEKKRLCLETVLALNPSNERAQQALAIINNQQDFARERQSELSSAQGTTAAQAPRTDQRSHGTCPSCGKRVDTDINYCGYCGTRLLRETSGQAEIVAGEPSSQGESDGSQLVGLSKGKQAFTKRTEGGCLRTLSIPVIIVAAIVAICVGLCFSTYVIGLFNTSSDSQTRPTARYIPPTYTPSTGGLLPTRRPSEGSTQPGVGYLMIEDDPLNSVPIISMMHDRLPVDSAEFARWVLRGEACLVEPGTRAYLEDWGFTRVEFTVLEGTCIDFYGWTVSEFWQTTR